MPCNLLWWLRPERVHATACATLTTSSNTCLGVRRPTVSVSRRSSTAGSVSRPNRGVAKRHATRLGTRGRRTQGRGRCQYLCANPVAQRADDRQTLDEHHVDGRCFPCWRAGSVSQEKYPRIENIRDRRTRRGRRNGQTDEEGLDHSGKCANRAVDYRRGRSSRRRGRPIPSALESFCAQRPALPACERSRRVRNLRAKSHERLVACAKTGRQRPRAPMHHEKDVFMRTCCKAKPTRFTNFNWDLHKRGPFRLPYTGSAQKTRAHRLNRQRQQWCRAVPTQPMLCDCESAKYC